MGNILNEIVELKYKGNDIVVTNDLIMALLDIINRQKKKGVENECKVE